MNLVEIIRSHPAIVPVVLVGIVALVVRFVKQKKLMELVRKIPGPPRYPLVGSLFELLVPREDLCSLQFRLGTQYGQRCMMPIAGAYYLMLSNPNDVEKILSSSSHINKGDMYEFLMPWLGEGLLTSQGRKWQRRRKLLTPAFHFKILEDFMVVFNENAKTLVEILHSEFVGCNDVGGKDMFPHVTRCALDVICETAMGRQIHAQHQRDSPYVKAVYRICELLVYRAFRPWFKQEFLWKLSSKGREYTKCLATLHSFTETVIRERKAEREKMSVLVDENGNLIGGVPEADDGVCCKKQRLAFLDLLLDAQGDPTNMLSDLDIREEVDTFMFEGHDTTAASLGWTLFLLASHPEHQVKVIQELESIFGDDQTRPVTTEDLTKMKYLESCIKESLRLYPSVPFIARCLNKDLVLDEGTTVPSGVNIVLLGMQIHRNPAIFPDPETFNPERFLLQNASHRHPFAYIPFSAGPRNCIGQKFALMEEKVILSSIFRNFFIEAMEKLEDLVVMIELITRPRDGFKVKLHNLDTQFKEKLYDLYEC